MLETIMLEFDFTELYTFVYDLVLLVLIFRAGKNKDTAVPPAKGKRL